MIERLVKAGMDCARLNFSHGTHSEHLQVIDSIRKISRKLGAQISILQDLPGPKIRVGKLKGGSVYLKKGSVLFLSSTEEVFIGKNDIPIIFPNLASFVLPGATIFLSDGSIRLRVIETGHGRIKCRCETGGELLSGKGVNIPRLDHDFETFTDLDKKHLEFGLKHGVDLVAVSFVRKASDIQKARNFLGKKDSGPYIIAKIEKREAVEDIQNIIHAADAIMIARGDLGVENPIEQVPMIQKSIISQCRLLATPVITATQMLESMVNNSSPTRAEVTDVANAIFDGTDAVMLSEETAVGKHPIECVQVLNRISLTAEKNLLSNDPQHQEEMFLKANQENAISQAAFQISRQANAALVVTPTNSWSIATKISKFRPKAPILALTDSDVMLRKLRLVWGVNPVIINKTRNLTGLLDTSVETLVRQKLVKQGDKLVIVCDSVKLSKEKGALLLVIEAGSND